MTSQTLLSCARLGRLYDIKRLVAAGHDLNVLIGTLPLKQYINALLTDGSTPLLAAINHNQFPVFEYLMQNGADPNLVDQDGWSGLHLAVLNSMCDHGGYPTMAYVQRLVEAGLWCYSWFDKKAPT